MMALSVRATIGVSVVQYLLHKGAPASRVELRRWLGSGEPHLLVVLRILAERGVIQETSDGAYDIAGVASVISVLGLVRMFGDAPFRERGLGGSRHPCVFRQGCLSLRLCFTLRTTILRALNSLRIIDLGSESGGFPGCLRREGTALR